VLVGPEGSEEPVPSDSVAARTREVLLKDLDVDERRPAIGVAVHRQPRVVVESLEQRIQALLEGLEDIQESFPVRVNPRGRNREMLEQAKAPRREIQAQIEPLDGVVDVDGADEDVEPVGEGLQELADLVMVRLELLPRL
jgi:hypothetical protein